MIYKDLNGKFLYYQIANLDSQGVSNTANIFMMKLYIKAGRVSGLNQGAWNKRDEVPCISICS
jgi:hypothetical protein